jgi:hypothetical protein
MERFPAVTVRGILYPLEEWVNWSSAATIRSMRQLPEQCESCKRQIATLEACVLTDGTEKRDAEVTFKDSVEGGIRCRECADDG